MILSSEWGLSIMKKKQVKDQYDKKRRRTSQSLLLLHFMIMIMIMILL